MALKAVHGRMLEDYLALLKRRWLVVAICIGVGLALGYGYLAVADKTYVSSAKVLVVRTSTDPVAEGSRTTESVNLDTEAQLVKSVPVATLAEEELDTELSPIQLARRVTVIVPPNTTVLEISFAASSPERARAGAQAFAEAYLEYRQSAAETAIGAQIDALRGEIERTSDQLSDLNVQLAEEDSAVVRAALLAERDSLSSRLTALNGQLSPLRGAVVSPGRIIVDAQTPANPRDPNPMLVLPSALFLGLIAGFAFALWRERADKRIHSVPDIDRLFGMTPLAELTATVGSGTGPNSIHYDVRALYHSLRANGPEVAETVLVVAPDAAPVAHGVSLALGAVAARSGATTTYLMHESPGLTWPGVHPQASGGALTTVLYDDVDLVHDGEINAERLALELRRLRANNDFVVLGLPSDDPAVDLPMLSRHADLVLVLVRLGRATRAAVGETLRTLGTSGARTVFVVSVDMRRHGPSRAGLGRPDTPQQQPPTPVALERMRGLDGDAVSEPDSEMDRKPSAKHVRPRGTSSARSL
jgi:capsular polysaccharide biosynthesis protein